MKKWWCRYNYCSPYSGFENRTTIITDIHPIKFIENLNKEKKIPGYGDPCDLINYKELSEEEQEMIK